jgi:hypothetical protein
LADTLLRHYGRIQSEFHGPLRVDLGWELLIAERAAAPGLIAELWRRFPAERLRLIRSDPRFDSIGLVQALIERGRKARAPAPLLAAFEILRCSGSRSHPAVRRELQAEALCELGEIYLERREPARAESCWARAAGVVAGSVDRSTVQRHRALGAAIRAEKGPARTQ